MKEKESAKIDRKLVKLQVERRRRERINHSLENLRTLLLQEPLQGATQPRVEKAEVLEHTVLFLQNTADGDNRRTLGGGQQHPFQDGFSTCLQRATQFLGPQGESLSLVEAVNATFSARMTYSACVGKAATEACSSSSLPSMTLFQSAAQLLMQKTPQIKHRQRAYPLNRNSPISNRFSLKDCNPRVPQQPLGPNHHEVRPRAPNQTQSQSFQASQSLWRPWP